MKVDQMYIEKGFQIDGKMKERNNECMIRTHLSAKTTQSSGLPKIALKAPKLRPQTYIKYLIVGQSTYVINEVNVIDKLSNIIGR